MTQLTIEGAAVATGAHGKSAGKLGSGDKEEPVAEGSHHRGQPQRREVWLGVSVSRFGPGDSPDASREGRVGMLGTAAPTAEGRIDGDCDMFLQRQTAKTGEGDEVSDGGILPKRGKTRVDRAMKNYG